VPSEQITAADKILEFFKTIKVNEPVAIKEIQDATGVSWPYIKKILQSGELNIHFKKSSGTWIAWKSTEHIGHQYSDSCAKLIRETPQTQE